MTSQSQDTFQNHDVYVEMNQHQRPIAAPSSDHNAGAATELTPQEVAKLRAILSKYGSDAHRGAVAAGSQAPRGSGGGDDDSLNSNYPEFSESTHAWAVFADNPNKKIDRVIGTIIIAFQVFTYWLFAAEAIEDYRAGAVPVLTTHERCAASDQEPEGNFVCEAESTSDADAFVSFFMLGIFLAADVQQAMRAVRRAHSRTALAFAVLTVVEVVAAFVAAAVSISQKLYIGEVTDAVEAGVGLLFIRELSTRAYHAIRQRNKTKHYRSFFLVLVVVVAIGMVVHPLCEALFAP